MYPPIPPLESQQKTCVFWIVGIVCERELEGKRAGKKHSRRKTPFAKRQVLFAPLVCIAMHPPTPPLESQQKTCVFLIVCMACDREPAGKRAGEKHPMRKTPSAKRQVLFASLVCIAMQPPTALQEGEIFLTF